MSIRISSLVAVALAPSVHPSIITLCGLFVGIATGVFAILAVDVRPTWLPGALVLLGWQLAYVLDCADGQIARATGKTSSAGAAVDILCDFAVQSTLVTAICSAVAKEDDVPVVVLALFAATWMVNLLVVVLYRQGPEEGHSLLRSKNALVIILKLSRDYGFLILGFGLSYAFWRPALWWLVVAVLVVNTSFLMASIANQAHLSLIATAEPERHGPQP